MTRPGFAQAAPGLFFSSYRCWSGFPAGSGFRQSKKSPAGVGGACHSTMPGGWKRHFACEALLHLSRILARPVETDQQADTHQQQHEGEGEARRDCHGLQSGERSRAADEQQRCGHQAFEGAPEDAL